MKNDKHLEKLANGIADLIVELVERTNGPVTLAKIACDIRGFAKNGQPAWDHIVTHADGETLIWRGMTEAGEAALHKVMCERRVAIQYVNVLPYLMDDWLIDDEHWQPILLLPARAANLESPNKLIRASQEYREYAVARAAAQGKTGYRLLAPGSVRYTADEFSVDR
jgi:hypothetical protein